MLGTPMWAGIGVVAVVTILISAVCGGHRDGVLVTCGKVAVVAMIASTVGLMAAETCSASVMKVTAAMNGVQARNGGLTIPR